MKRLSPLESVKVTPQARKVLEYMIIRPWISQLYALKEFGVERLASRIHELKVAGVPIKKTMTLSFAGKKYARYFLDPDLR